MTQHDWGMLFRSPGYILNDLNAGATEPELAELAAWAGHPLPEDYAAFLRFANGGEVRYRDLWVIHIWSAAEIPERSRMLHFLPEYLPHALLFGSDTSDEGLVFDIRFQHPDGQYPIYSVDYISVGDGWDAAIHVADSFHDLLLLRDRLLHEVQMGRGGLSNHHAPSRRSCAAPTVARCSAPSCSCIGGIRPA